ncbi:MAG TPA: glycine cleavage T C-terminal barrel domain-containing protein [Longimicrobiales bacterium]|nr:glycine cleavage T C-terminal barrel domain-containing protein [Longimicrobiales bacterium]
MSRLDAMHDAAGARWSEGPVRVPRNYGHPAAEYDVARSDVVVAERADRSIVRVHGRDPVKMVQGLISNDIVNAPANRAVYAAVLTPKGRMVADVRVVRHGADLLLETDAAAAEPLMAHLRKFVPPLFAKFEDANDTWSELGVYGPRARDVLAKLFGMDVDGDVVEDELFTTEIDGAPVIVVATSHFGVAGFDIIVAAHMAEGVWQDAIAAGARPIGFATLDVLRIEAGSPRWGAELIDTTIPLEAGLRDRAISQTKGCYTGQEVIVRILHRGHVNWLLRRVMLGDIAAPAPDTALVNEDGKKVGRITSAAWSAKYGQTIALGYVRREVEPGTMVWLESVEGAQVEVVAIDADAPGTADAEPTLQNVPESHGSAP